MPVSVSMHACSAYPVNVDLTSFRFFLEGCSVEETVEQLMALQSATPSKTPRKARSSSSSSTVSTSHLADDSPEGSALSSSPTAARPTFPLPPHPPRPSGGAATPTLALQASESELLMEDKRVADEEENPEELILTPSFAKPSTEEAPASTATATTGCISGTHTPTVAGAGLSIITAVDTGTNTPLPKSASPAVQTLHNRHAHNRRRDGSAISLSQQHHQRRQSHTSRHRTQESNSLFSTKKSRHTHSRARSGNASTPSTTADSFSLPPLGTSGEQTHPRHASMDDLTLSMTAGNGSNRDGCAAGGPNANIVNGNLGGSSSSNFHNDSSHHKSSANNAGGGNENAEGKPGATARRPATRQKKRKERQCFFLNEDFIKFQRQLQEVEAIGGVGAGASTLQSRYLFEEVTEQFQLFREVAQEEQLGSPYAFLSNYYLPIPVSTRLELLHMYYETDAGVFRWAFGDKLNKFDLPNALTVAREELLSGNALGGGAGHGARNGHGDGSSGAGGVGSAAGNANSGGGGGSFFWPGRWKSSPGKLATMDVVTLTRLSEHNTESLRRQWENVKHVCVTVAALYRGRGGMCVPLDMSLLTTIQQCFGLRHEQALDYTTAAFGFEHRLETRLFERLHNFSEYGAICSIVASLWCDDSGYFLSGSFRVGCRRVGRLLDEYRFLSELHLLLFGEAMRPRWQVQLDEVQRVITTSSLVDKNTVATATAVTSGSPLGSSANLALSPNVGNTGAAFGNIGTHASTTVHAVGSNPSAGLAGGAAAAAGAGGASAVHYGNGNVSGLESTGASPTTAGAASANNTNNVHSFFSGNGQYSRRFVLEFPSLMKHLFRICVALDGNGGINDALDIFFTRVYSYLDMVSSRTAPTLVSIVMNAAASGGLTSMTGVPPAGPGSLAAGGSGNAIGGTSGLGVAGRGRPPLPPYVDRGRSQSDMMAGGGASYGAAVGPRTPPPPGAAGISSSPASPTRHQSGSATAAAADANPKASSSPFLSNLGGGARRNISAATIETNSPAAGPTTAFSDDSRAASNVADDVYVPGSSIPYAASTVVNTSLFHPASTLIPLSAAIAAHNGTGTGSSATSPLATAVAHSGRGFGSEEELPDWNVESIASGAAAAAAIGATDASFHGAAAGNSSNALSAQVTDMVRKAVEKRYLRELCMLLAALPKAWKQLTVLTEEDHVATDKTMSNFAMALKAVTQVLMASDDFQ